MLFLVVLCLYFGCITVSPGHSPGEISSAKSCEGCGRLETPTDDCRRDGKLARCQLWSCYIFYDCFTSLLTRIKLYFVVYTSSLHAATYVPIFLSSSSKSKFETAPLASKHPNLLIYHSANHFDAHRLHSNTKKAW